MKLFALVSALVISVLAEPPVDHSYLPPSSQYGPPPAAAALSTQYAAPSVNAISNHYGAPAVTSAALGRYSAVSKSTAAQISSSFGTPSFRRFGAGGRIGTTVSQGLSARNGNIFAGRSIGLGGLGLSAQYGAPSHSSDALSGHHGASSSHSGLSGAAQLSSVYGVPGYGYGRAAGSQEDALSEPSSYQFSYSVQDAGSLSDFGHDEARQDESAQGEYRVLLPDGRKQIVSYQADENGYRPTIEYVDTGLTANSVGGYNYGRGGSGAGNGGYHY